MRRPLRWLSVSGLLLPILAVAMLAIPPTGELKTARFRIVHTQAATGAATVLSQQIEPLRDQLQQVLGRDWDGVTEIRVGMGRQEYEALALPGGAPPSWAVALAYPESNIILVDAHSLVKGDGQSTLRHELVHVALGRLGHSWPRWFHEGLAQMVTGEQRYSVTQYATIARAVNTDRIFRFEDLAEGFPDLPQDVEIAYAQSAAFVAWLHDRKYAKSTIARRLAAVRSFGKFLCRGGVLASNPAQGMRGPRLEKQIIPLADPRDAVPRGR